MNIIEIELALPSVFKQATMSDFISSKSALANNNLVSSLQSTDPSWSVDLMVVFDCFNLCDI